MTYGLNSLHLLTTSIIVPYITPFKEFRLPLKSGRASTKSGSWSTRVAVGLWELQTVWGKFNIAFFLKGDGGGWMG